MMESRSFGSEEAESFIKIRPHLLREKEPGVFVCESCTGKPSLCTFKLVRIKSGESVNFEETGEHITFNVRKFKKRQLSNGLHPICDIYLKEYLPKVSDDKSIEEIKKDCMNHLVQIREEHLTSFEGVENWRGLVPSTRNIQKFWEKLRRKMSTNAQQDLKKRPREAQMGYDHSDYVFKAGLRFVKPYVFGFKTFAKQRWYGRTLLEIFTTEFGGYPPEYYEKAIKDGRVTVRDKVATVDRIIENGDWICHSTHRHEPPVCGSPVKIEAETDDTVVINKPSTIPIHPCGAYRFNSLEFILAKEHPRLSLNVVHRLDRLTSGLVLMAKSKEATRELTEKIRSNNVQKWYLAKVKGVFPMNGEELFTHAGEEIITAKSPSIPFLEKGGDEGMIRRDQMEKYASWVESEESSFEEIGIPDKRSMVEVTAPIHCVNHRDGVQACHIDGKEAITRFHRISTDGEMSVILCQPITGRTHQIRVHLNFLGYPIANDVCYGGLAELDSGLKTVDERTVLTDDEEKEPPRKRGDSEDFDAKQLKDLKEACRFCQLGPEAVFNNEQLRSGGIWLHAWRYESKDFHHQVSLPDWMEK
eukprot:TRINITY_DN15260_c0_g1_i1.p1 TRINITY_DN15260_c0_g1~~TRINITY_DN15260_c0_g1_i1.p1  ORF type:complete len:586 (-),score=158.62 TRINITY_DN15260_c0_g1_i1:274-2031(-)